VLFGPAPAVRAPGVAPGAVLKSAGRGMSAGRDRFGLRRVLVVAQVALSLVLLVGALLSVRSLSNLMTLDAAFQRDGILVLDVTSQASKLLTLCGKSSQGDADYSFRNHSSLFNFDDPYWEMR
jgi:hypothetical protein